MNKKVFAIVLLSVIAGVVYWKRDIIKQKILQLKNKSILPGSSEENPSGSGSGTSSGGGYTECTAFPIKRGCKGEMVKKIQDYLNKDFKANLTVDGKFGLQTEAALEKAGFGKTLEKQEALKYINKNS